MKKLTLFAACALMAMLFASCGKDYSNLVGTWGVEKIEYYNIDYAGQPIPATIETYTSDPNSTDNGFQLVFRENKSGEMRDSAIDTILIDWNTETLTYDSFIVNPDTVIVYPFTCSYDRGDRILYMNMDYITYIRTFKMYVSELTDNTFVYENEYDKDYVERAYLKRVSKSAAKSASRQKAKHPHKPGSFFGDR